ncbi:DUF3304 domain-containing protein [Testudinibacter sp. TR-2022]|uniref:DUF3304 domain-containing protein n=2 Tax=Testudinibacter sp. TR-2022 TaxID=2585029 RepID=UPI001117E2C9|nr:DUF3304 domain-containing protein [Testudinibacter sp. TR-2022]TNH02474.1 DUF3304 domain-containing protein [Pasteurellaceae bacterium Phil31]TNH10970.1 DUF3304 domain-containing protein [Testudinibacter sp. TR-2022]TNH14491.1 DUF3304 domain-containing protein [Testudinibacter sp. TR-2022]
MNKTMLVSCGILLGLSACSSAYQPFVGIVGGKNESYFAPVEALVYTYESVLGGNVNGGCIPNTSGVALDQVGKRRWGGGSTCGGMTIPATWRPGLTVRVHWRITPYSQWGASFYPREKGGGLNQEEVRIIKQYNETYTAIVPLPPPNIGTDLGKGSNITVHFLACNQLFIDYGTSDEDKLIKRDFELMDKSLKLCSKRPVVKSMADYRKHKARMDEVRLERKNIPQVILPQYIEEVNKVGMPQYIQNLKDAGLYRDR